MPVEEASKPESTRRALPPSPLLSSIEEEIDRIAAELISHAQRAPDGSLIWQGPTGYGTTGSPFRYRRLLAHLYEGSCGVAFFLAALAAVRDDDSLKDLAAGALRPLRGRLRRLVRDTPDGAELKIPLGGLVGLGSFAYTLLWAGRLLDRPEMIREALDLTTLFTPDRIRADRRTRVQTGSAGAVLALLALHGENPEENSRGRSPLQLAELCGEHLLDSRVAFDGGPRAWLLADGKPPLPGFCYGAAGAAYALLQLHAVTGREDFLEAAREGLEFIHRLWVPEQGSWRDIRPYFEARHEPPPEGWHNWWSTETVHHPVRRAEPEEAVDRFPNMWCHGSSGMVLARIAALPIEDRTEIRDEIESVLRGTRRIHEDGHFETVRINDLCCGHAGHVEVLLEAGRRLDSAPDLDAADALIERLLRRRREQGGYELSAARGRDVFAPSLFQGLSGVGYTYLRRIAPDTLPCVLILEA